MTQDKLKKLKALMEVANEDHFSYKEAVKFFEVLVKAVKDARSELKQALANNENLTKKEIADLLKVLENKDKMAKELMIKMQGKIKEMTDKEMTRMSDRLEKIRQEIPEMPDLSEIHQKIDQIVIPTPEEIQEKIEKKLPQYGEVFRDGLELLEDDDRLDISAIKGWEELWEELLAKIEVKQTANTNHSIVGRDIITDIDISDDLDGVTKTFNIQAIYNIISVSLSSYPYGTLRKNIDYTFTPTTITFTDQIAADTQLSEGQKCIITAVLS